MTPEQALKTKALANSGVTALIAQRWNTEIALTKGIKYPYVIAATTEVKDVGDLGGPSGFVIGEVSLGIYGSSHDSVADVANALRIALQDTKGNITFNAETRRVTIQKPNPDENISEPPIDAGELPLFGIKQVYTVSMAQATS